MVYLGGNNEKAVRNVKLELTATRPKRQQTWPGWGKSMNAGPELPMA